MLTGNRPCRRRSGFRDGMIEADLTELTGKRFGSTRRVGEPLESGRPKVFRRRKRCERPCFL